MNQLNVETLTLFDLLARQWQAPGVIAALKFSADGALLAATTEAGTLAIAALADAEPPESRIRITGDLGQTTIRPRSGAPAPLILVSGLADRAPAIAATAVGFLVGDGSGRVLRIAGDGSSAAMPIALGGPITAIDHAPATGAIAAADASELVVSTDRRPLPGIVGLAFAADGGRLAAALGDRIVLVDGATRDLPLPATGALRWRGDGACLAAALGTAGLGVATPAGETATLGNFPAPVRCIDWSAPAGALVAAGAFRITAWDAASLPGGDLRPLVCGRAGLVLVEAVAAHPQRRLVAAGYVNGQVLIAEIGGRDELMLRQQGAAVTALAFSPDGNHLAIGDADGALAIATFPPQMFK